MAMYADEARSPHHHRPARRLVQSGAWRPPRHHAVRARGAGARRGLVAGLARQSAEAARRHGAARAPAWRGPAMAARARRSASPRSSANLHTRYTVDTLRAAAAAAIPRPRFIWLMGADNLAQFHAWKDWRGIARTMPIAVIARPGYDARPLARPRWAGCGASSGPQASAEHWTTWRLPALVLLRFRPDPRSATLLRQADPHWHRSFAARHACATA